MNYQKIYNNIIANSKFRALTKENGFEFHHIIPKSLGGTDNIENIVKLTFKEHYICHLLLIKMQTNIENKFKMSNALLLMCKSNNGIRSTNSKMFEKARLNLSISAKNYQNEIDNKTGKTRAKIRNEKIENRFKHSKQTVFKWFNLKTKQHEECSCFELSLKYKELKGCSSNLLKVSNNTRQSCHNWVLLENKDINLKMLHKNRMSISAKLRGNNGNQYIFKDGTKRIK